MNEAILEKKIKLWEDQLLDLGKRNKMISFRETKRTTLKILKPSFEEFYQQIVVDERELTFQKAIDKDSDVRVYSILSLMDKLSCPIEVNVGDIRAEGSLPEIKKTLKHLRSKARLAMDEQGTNILYLVFGFIEWREKGNRSNSWVKSPLILVPISLSLPSLNAQYSIKKHEDEIVVNPTLAYLFERDYGITLPEFDSDKDTLESFIQKMEALVDERGWRIVRECSMGLVSFLKISMYNDLVRNEEQLKANPIIRAFAGEQNEVNSRSGETEKFDHDSCRAVDSYLVLDADSSQQDAVMLSHKGVSFVMEGPPGTGKSQTITNIIAQGLADGKKILFVSEKMAALDVVYRRLTDVHLAEFCLSLHSHKANKKDILNQLGNNLSLPRLKVKDEEVAKLTRLDTIKEQLQAYVQDIHTTVMPLEMSLYEVYGAILELSNLPDIGLHLPDVDKLTKDDVNRLALLIMDLDQAQGVLGPQWYKNPWQGITGSYLEVSQKRELQNKLQNAIRILSALEECKLIDKTLADIITLDSLDAFWALCKQAWHCAAIPNSWFSRTTEQEEKLVLSLFEKKKNIDELSKLLAEKYDHGFFDLNGSELLSQFTNSINNCRSMLRHVSSDEEAFNRLERDQVQLQQLHETSALLIDAFTVLSEEYKLALPCEYSSIESMFTICNMLLEKRNVTSWYFGDDHIQHLKRYSENLRKKLALLESRKAHLCERYSEIILKVTDADQLLHRLISAMEVIEKIDFKGDSDYTTLETVASFDIGRIQRIEDAHADGILADVSAKFGFEPPCTLNTVQHQILALKSLPSAKTVQRWQTPSGRKNTKQLISAVIDRTAKLSDAKAKSKVFFDQAGIALDVDKLSSDDLQQLCKANNAVPEAAIILESCNSSEAYELLDTIDRNVAELAKLNQKIAAIREEYHIASAIDNNQLLNILLNRRYEAEFCTPILLWADAKTDAYSLLEQVIALANELRNQHNQLTAVYEESVFSLDYAAMLNRFKAEYTSFLKIFKGTYKADVKQIRLECKQVRKKISDEEIISLLQSLRQYNEDLEKYQRLSSQITRLLDISEYDIWYDWDNVKRRLDAFYELCPIFDNGKDAYRFITTASWDNILTLLARIDKLNNWFADNEKAESLYGDLYKMQETNTDGLRDVLNHARSVCALFASKAYYLRFISDSVDAKDVQNGIKQAADVVETREWFANKAKEIEEYTGVIYDEFSNPWKDVANELEVYEDIVSTFGEDAAYSLVTNYRNNEDLIQRYLNALQIITSAEDCAKTIYHVDAISKEISDTGINALLKNMRQIVASANELMTVYTFVATYCPESYAELRIGELKNDLEAIQFYQDTLKQLPELAEEAHIILGPDYNDLATNWDTIDANICFCEKVNTLLSGNVPAELVSAFVNATSVYSESQLSELWQYLTTAQEIDCFYREISFIRDLNAKIHTLSDVLTSLKNAIDVKTVVSRNAFSPCPYVDFIDDLRKLAMLQTIQTAYTEELSQAQKRMPTFDLSAETDWAYTTEVFDHMKQVKRAISSGNLDAETVRWLTNGISGITVSTYYAQVEKLIRSISYFTDITSMFANQATMESFSLTKLGRRFRNCDEQFSTMDAWIDLRDCKKACQDNGLEEFVLKAEDAYYPEGTLKDVFLKSFYYEWFEKTCSNMESVANFRVRTQETRVDTFRELDAHQLPINQMRIREHLIREMPSKHNFGRATDEMSILLHELSKKRNIMPLRKLFRTIPNLLLRLKPCLMMSPLSVSYFLEAETYKFDMVIFDEASQIFPQDAIGAISRGKQVIIAGDPKQLPPTNFFAASTNNDADFDVDDEDIEECVYDSILEEAINSLLLHSLLWHYRSRYEDLISFSNQEIYQNSLITFPSNTAHIADTGVEYVYVKNGVYESRCNRAEAQQIVQIVADHIKKHPDRSLGVIAFSESQQSVIEEEINKFRLQNPFHERFFDEDTDEPFFVKNLETVQGDERDTIIFSICYGKNAQGRMYMRFGPLGHPGGERRLNVAITRAKYNIKLVGSILPEDIPLSSIHSEGVRMLRSYIDFAMRGSCVLAKHEKKNHLYDVDTFSEQVGKFLAEHGCNVQMHVGNSDYTIDIAVEHPKQPGHYIAGIECDGNSYCMARTVRDREHLRTAVLEQMGWKMYRVWSTEWIRNPEAEQERLMQFVRDALLHYGEAVSSKNTIEEISDVVGTEVVKASRPSQPANLSNPYNLNKYVEGKWWNRKRRRGNDNLSNIADMIRAVVEIEQPIHMELLYKRIGPGFTAGKATQGVRDTIDEAIKQRMQGEVVIEDQFIRLANFTEVQARRSEIGAPDRNIEHISIPEIAAAMEKILVGAYGMDRNVLCSEAAKVFGYERSGAKIKQRTSDAVDYLVRNHKVTIYDGKVQLLEG